MYTLVKHPPVPFTTLTGSSRGPAVFIGRDRSERNLYVGEPEIRGIVKALAPFGWVVPEKYAKAIEQRDAAVAHAARLERELSEARDQVAALELVVSIRKPEPVVEEAV